MIDENYVVKLSKDVLRRYEESINDGVLFLYDVKSHEYWMGNRATNDLVKTLDGKKTLKDIYAYLQQFYPGFDKKEVKESFESIISELLEKKFITIVTDN